jgi:hypothetical protein
MVAILGVGALGIAFDRTMSVRGLREAARMNALANSAFEGIAVCRAGVVVHINESFCTLLQATGIPFSAPPSTSSSMPTPGRTSAPMWPQATACLRR